MIEEAIVTCPACWETITLDVDLSGGPAEYAEDCPVCCRPMTVQLRVLDDGGFEVDVRPESD